MENLVELDQCPIKSTPTRNNLNLKRVSKRNSKSVKCQSEAILVYHNRLLTNGTFQKIPRFCGSKSKSNTVSEEERNRLFTKFIEDHHKMCKIDTVKAIEVYFRALLIKRGDHIGGINKKTLKCKNDGNVFKYPKYTRVFLEAGVFHKLSDFKACNRKKALSFAIMHVREAALKSKRKGKSWLELSQKSRNALLCHRMHDLMHGFDDLVSCLELCDNTCQK